MRERDEPKPVSLYGISKLAAEKLCQLYYDSYGVPVVILRYFNVYGPRQRPDMAFHKFIKAILKGKEMTVYGDGKQTRDFTYVTDVVDGSIMAMTSDICGEIFNIEGSTCISVREVINMLEKLSGKKAKINFVPPLKCEPRNTMADISKAERLLGYRPKVSIREGLAQQLDYIKASGAR